MILTKENYFSPQAEKEYLGSSSFKAWDIFNKGLEAYSNFIEGGCEEREIAIINGAHVKEDKKAFLIGHYVHSYAEGKEAFQQFIDENHSKIYKKNGSLYADFERADLMIEALKNDPLMLMVLEGEKEQIFTGIIGGQKFKIRIDALNHAKKSFSDLKTTDKITGTAYKNGKRVSFIDAYDYKLQAAIYEEILFQNIGEHYEMYIPVVDKKPVPDHEIIYLGKKTEERSFFDEKLEYIESRLTHIVSVRSGETKPERCEKCEYCRSTKKLTKPISLAEFDERLGIKND